mgnify:CR=1 FL=1
MLPYYTYRNNPIFTLKIKKKFVIYIKENILYFLLYFYPRFFARFFNYILKIKIFNNLKFIRSDCDHFGSWLFLLISLRVNENNHKNRNNLYLCLAKRKSINKNLLSYFYKYNLIIIYNPILQFFIAPLFFTLNSSIDVNGHFPLSYIKNKKVYPNYQNIGPINENFLNKFSFKKKISNSRTNLLGNKRGLVIFYPRLGNWKLSAKKSRRNMSIKIAEILIENISKSNDLILLGDTFKYFSGFNNIYDFDNVLENGISPHEIFSLTDCIIGSISGATHFPSLLYNLPTLYIGDIPLDHLIAIYNMIPKKNKKKNSIPRKDNWFIYDFRSLEEIDDMLWKMISTKFLSEKRLGLNNSYETYNLETNYFKNENSNFYNLLPSKNGNLHIHKSYKEKN